MVENVLENMKAEAGDPLISGARGCLPRSTYGTEQLMDSADEQVVFSAKMHVEGGTAHVGAIQDLLYGDLFIGLFASERNECLNPAILRQFSVSLHI
jgi:hypothetical protein